MKRLTVLLLIVFTASFAQAQKVFIGSKFNDTGNELSMLVQNKYKMTEKKSEMKDGVMSVYYIPKVFTANEQSISLHYTLTEDGTIKNIEVKGTFKEVISLFAAYWKTKADYSTNNSIAEKHFVSDVIRLQKGNKSAYIIVSGS